MWIGQPSSYAICQVPQSYDKQGQRVALEINPSITSGQTSTTYLFADYVDADNHHRLRIDWSVTTLSSYYTAYVEKLTGGVVSSVANFTGVWSAASSWPIAQLCVSDGVVMGTIITNTGATTTNIRRSESHGGRLSGYGVGGTRPISVRNFSFKRHKGTTALDEFCDKCAGNWNCGSPSATCVGGTLPMSMKVVIQGLANGVDGYNENGDFIPGCTGCVNLNGIYTLRLYYTSANLCSFIYEPIPDDCYQGDGYLRIICNLSQYGYGYPTVSVSMWYANFALNPDVSWLTQWSGDCSNIEDLPLSFSSASTSTCNTDVATCVISALP